MAKYCIYCDRPILDGKPCPCRVAQQNTAAPSPDRTSRCSYPTGSTASAKKTGKRQRAKRWNDGKASATVLTRFKSSCQKKCQRLTNAWRKRNYKAKMQQFWQNLTEFIYQPTKITTRLDRIQPTSPLLLVFVQLGLIYLWAINFLQHTNLGHFWRYTEKTYLETNQNLISRMAVNIVFILAILHLTKLIFTYLCLRIQHYHVTWRQVYRLSLPANIISTLVILISFLFLYGSGFISLGILFFASMAATCLDYLTIKNNFNFQPNKALLFTWILYLLVTIAIAGTIELIFPHISSFYMNSGIRF